MIRGAKGRIERRMKTLEEIANDNSLLEVGRAEIERVLMDWRDSRLSEMGRGNGLVIREKDGKSSDVIRFGPESALRIGLLAIAKHLGNKPQ